MGVGFPIIILHVVDGVVGCGACLELERTTLLLEWMVSKVAIIENICDVLN